jgi:hypothetical protein
MIRSSASTSPYTARVGYERKKKKEKEVGLSSTRGAARNREGRRMCGSDEVSVLVQINSSFALSQQHIFDDAYPRPLLV